MASRLFFDPLVALRAAPLVSSTCTLLFAWDQHLFLSTLNKPEVRKLSKPMLPRYFKRFFYSGLPIVIGFLTATTSSVVANIYTQRAALQARGSLWWYATGAVLAVSHLAFVPLIAPSVKATIDAGPDDDANKFLDEWLSVNALRSLTVDLGAWVAVVVAVIKTLRA